MTIIRFSLYRHKSNELWKKKKKAYIYLFVPFEAATNNYFLALIIIYTHTYDTRGCIIPRQKLMIIEIFHFEFYIFTKV